MKKNQQMQRREIPLLQRIMRMVSGLNVDERIVLVKAIAADLGDPLYTQSEMEERLRQHQFNEEQKKRLQAVQRDVEEFQTLIQKGRF